MPQTLKIRVLYYVKLTNLLVSNTSCLHAHHFNVPFKFLMLPKLINPVPTTKTPKAQSNGTTLFMERGEKVFAYERSAEFRIRQQKKRWTIL